MGVNGWQRDTALGVKMIFVNLFVCVLCAVVSKQAFENGLNGSGWFNLVFSAANMASFMADVI